MLVRRLLEQPSGVGLGTDRYKHARAAPHPPLQDHLDSILVTWGMVGRKVGGEAGEKPRNHRRTSRRRRFVARAQVT